MKRRLGWGRGVIVLCDLMYLLHVLLRKVLLAATSASTWSTQSQSSTPHLASIATDAGPGSH